ncbi:MAG: SMC-Scp complex subunit ScpB [Armatimonadota bacterium]|nr:SMC-Scp complex subunit ScpB [Armatimonadota bacterium]MDW8026098.1 SMC-Scp complex subunit ScpB [Armatimonadota bacterium]
MSGKSEMERSKDKLPLWNDVEAIGEGQLKRAIECLLFVSDKPLSLNELKEVLEANGELIKGLIGELISEYDERSGLAIVEVAGGYQMVTRPEYAFYVSRLRQPRRIRLSRASLETLAIIAYRQPITHPEIEHIRGVDSSGCIARLLELGLIKVVGRKESPGRPYLYATTERFLETFGLKDLSQLPPIEQWHERALKMGIEEDKDNGDMGA